MDDLIRRADVLALAKDVTLKNGEKHRCIDATLIHEIQSAEPKRKKGRWQISDAYPHNVYCPECHVKFAQTHWAVWEDGSLPRNFCPNCGADMKGT